MASISAMGKVSIRGRFAFGMVCLENVCRAWNVSSPPLSALLEEMWTFTGSMRLDQWDGRMGAIVPRTPQDFVDHFQLAGLSSRQQKILFVLIRKVWDIGAANLFSGYVSEDSLTPTLVVLRLLKVAGVPSPDLEPFRRSRVTLLDGWGKPVPPAFFRENSASTDSPDLPERKWWQFWK